MIEFLKEYSIYYKRYKFQLFLAFFGMLLTAVSTASLAYLVKPVLDKIFIQKNETMLYLLPVGVVLTYLFKGIGSILQQYYIGFISESVVMDLRQKLLSHIVDFDMDYFKSTHSGELVSRIINDITRIQNAVGSYLSIMARDIIMAIFLLGVVIYQNPKLALFSLVILPVMTFPINKISKKIKKLSKESQEKTASLNQSLIEIFSNIETIKAYNAKDYELNNFHKRNLDFFRVNLKTLKTKAFLVPILEVLSATVAAIVIIVGGKEVIDGSMSVGAFFSFLTALFMLTDPIRRVSINYSNMQDAIAANDRLKEILNTTPTIKSGLKDLKSIDSVEYKDLLLSYNNKVALKSINFNCSRGDKVALIGNSGGGKSSFVYLLERFYDASSGILKINGIDIKDYSIEALREKIAYIPQNIHIFNDTIANNIAYGKEVDKDRVLKALKSANLLDFIKSLPDGIDTLLQEDGSNLSGGQKQRVAIARALYNEPDILILDEATSALDNRSEKLILETIFGIKDKIIFVIAHKLSIVEYVDRVLLFKNGEIVANGIPDEVVKHKEFKKLLSSK